MDYIYSLTFENGAFFLYIYGVVGKKIFTVHPPVTFYDPYFEHLLLREFFENEDQLKSLVETIQTDIGTTYEVPKDKCKFFPNCKRSNCKYFHPEKTPICKYFPNCTREGCKYVHPEEMPVCKFFPNCTRDDCKYSHPTPEKIKICKEFPICNDSLSCKNVHPVPLNEPLYPIICENYPNNCDNNCLQYHIDLELYEI